MPKTVKVGFISTVKTVYDFGRLAAKILRKQKI